VGISPAEEGMQVAVYVPTGVNGSYAKSTAQAVFSGVWTNVLPGSDRDFTSGIAGVPNLRTSGFITSLNADPANLAAYKGDICAYLSGRPGIPAGYWRLPTSAEFEPSISGVAFSLAQYTRIRAGEVDESNDAAFTPRTSTNDVGTFVINSGFRLTYGEDKTTFFPTSGYRNGSSGALTNVGVSGYGWSSSPGAAYGYYLRMYSPKVDPDALQSRTQGFPVRCVRK
jgi:hypothetical protein